MFNRLTVMQRLVAGFGLVIMFLAIASTMLWKVPGDSLDRLETAQNDTVATAALAEAQNAVWELRYATPQFMVLEEEGRKRILDAEPRFNIRVEAAFKLYEATNRSPEELVALKNLRKAQERYMLVRREWFELYGAGKLEEANEFRKTSMTTSGYAMVKGVADQISLQKEFAIERMEAAVSETVKTRTVAIALGLAGLAIGVLCAWLIARSVLRSIGDEPFRVASMIRKVANGDLDNAVNVRKGDLASPLAALGQMVDRLRAFTLAQGEMARAHKAGDTDHRISAEQFPGKFGEMAAQVNELAASHLDVQQRMVDVISHYARGDFSVDMDRLPGKKIEINHAMDDVKANLEQIKDEIVRLADAAMRGDFTRRGDSERFEYTFREIVENLNRLMEVSDAGISDVAKILDALAKGDLTNKIDKRYEGAFGKLAEDSNRTVAQLTEIIGQIREASESIGTSSREIAAGNTDLSARTEQQAVSLEETASSMEELTATVKQNAENARQANELAASASGIAMSGGKVVSEVVGTMSSINESSRKIVDIISVIDGIAFQTNILALNAAVEAARAGEQGRGFAVVASEVRNLAQRSAAAAKEIKTLIGDSVDKVQTGTKLVDAAGKTMEDIVQAVKRVTDIMSEIAAASQDQSAGIEQVNQAITQMDQVTQQNAALVEEAAAAAESMREQAGSLDQAVSVFRLERTPQQPAARTTAPKRAMTPVAKVAVKPAAKPMTDRLAQARTRAAIGAGAEDEWEEF